jgi:hypothetical protein
MLNALQHSRRKASASKSASADPGRAVPPVASQGKGRFLTLLAILQTAHDGASTNLNTIRNGAGEGPIRCNVWPIPVLKVDQSKIWSLS